MRAAYRLLRRSEGASEEEMVPQIEDHAFQVHHLELKEEARNHIRQAIHDLN